MDNFKGWLLEVGLKKMGPSAVRAAILAVVGFIATKAEMFAQMGIVYDKATHIITIDCNVLNGGLTLLVVGAGGALIKMFNHHADKTVKAAAIATVSKPEETPKSPS